MRDPSASCSSVPFVPAAAQGGVVRLLDQQITAALPEHTRRFTRTGPPGHSPSGWRQVAQLRPSRLITLMIPIDSG